MATIKIKKGLDLPIKGAPVQTISEGPQVKRAALIGPDYPGMKPAMQVKVGDRVSLGQLLFTDKKNEKIRYTSPAAGTVAEINRGERRVFQSLVIDIDGDASESFKSYDKGSLSGLSVSDIKDNLLASGLWTALKSRPYARVADPDSRPAALFINCMDTSPLAADPAAVLDAAADDFQAGLIVLSRLSDKTFLCKSPALEIAAQAEGLTVQDFSGRHPAGLSGTHIHFLSPVSRERSAWYINYQDVISAGRLFLTGRLDRERIIALGGSGVREPRLIRTVAGARITELTTEQLNTDRDYRLISGSVLAGRTAAGAFDYLGRYHLQVSVIPEGHEREFLGWTMPGFSKFSVTRVYTGSLIPGRKLDLTTSTGGGKRAMVPTGMYEKVMPLDILATYLLRALLAGDIEDAENLGALELDEEDLALCTMVCPGKYDYGPVLREILDTIEREG